jgi:hypothetical protein
VHSNSVHRTKSDVAADAVGTGKLHQSKTDTSNSNVSCFCRVTDDCGIVYTHPGLAHFNEHANTDFNTDTYTTSYLDASTD